MAKAKVNVVAVQVGARGFIATSAYNFCKQPGIKGEVRTISLKNLSETSEKARCWVWSKGRDCRKACPMD